MEFSYSQTENFEMEKLSSDTGYIKKPVEINRGYVYNLINKGLEIGCVNSLICLPGCGTASPQIRGQKVNF